MSQLPRIIIIGAGLAGLVAAQFLRRYACEMVVVEARNRIGGRTWTSYEFGVPFDHGAFVIHGPENNPIAQLAEQLQLNYSSIEQQRVILAPGPQNIPLDQYQQFKQQFDSCFEQARQWAFQQPQDCSIESALQTIFRQQTLPVNSELFLSTQKNFYAAYYGADVTQLSARYGDYEEHLPGGNQILLSGYLPIAQHLAQGIKIIVDTAVTAVHYENQKVRLQTAETTYEAEAVIVTAPLGVLQKDLKFYPELPIAKQRALQHLQMGVLDKIALKFPRRFWPDNASVIVPVGKENSTPAMVSYFPFMQENILVAMIGGTRAKALELQKAEEVKEMLIAQLENLFGTAIAKPQALLRTRWAQDPYSHGSYSYYAVGATPEDNRQLALPVEERLFFAGEATHDKFPASTHGAYLSGLRAAQEVATALKLGALS